MALLLQKGMVTIKIILYQYVPTPKGVKKRSARKSDAIRIVLSICTYAKNKNKQSCQLFVENSVSFYFFCYF